MALKLGRAVVGLGRLAGAAGEREAVLRAALRAGVTAFETATYHGDGAADAVLVNALKSETRDRSSVTVLTRVGLVEGRRKSELAVRFQGREEGAPFSTVDEVTANVLDPDFLRAEVRAAAERLGGFVDGVVLVNPEDYVVSRANRHLQHPKAASSAARGAAARGAAARGATIRGATFGTGSGTMSGSGAAAPPGSVLLANGMGTSAGGVGGVVGGGVGGASEFTLAASADRWAHELRDHLRTAFAVLEEEVAAGRLRHYGVASEGFGETQSALAGFDPRPLVGLAADAARLVHGAHKRITPSSLALLEIAANPVERRAIQTLGPWARGLGLAVVLQRPLTARDRSGAPVPLIDPDITLARGRDDYSALLAALRDRFAVPSEPLAPDASEDEVATVEACQWMLSLLDQMDAQVEEYTSPLHWEKDLLTQVVPLIRDKLEAIDEESGALIAGFLDAYGRRVAVESAARSREFLRKPKAEGGLGYGRSNESGEVLGPDERTEDFALRWAKRSVERGLADAILLEPSNEREAEEMVRAVRE